MAKSKKALKKSYLFEIEIPSEIESSLNGNVITMKKNGKEAPYTVAYLLEEIIMLESN